MSIGPISFSKSGDSDGPWFSVTNWVDAGATISASEEITELPASNLTSSNADTIYRREGIVSGDSEITLDFDFTTARRCGVLMFHTTRGADPVQGDMGSTLSGASTVRHMLSNVSAGGTDVYDSGTISHGMVFGHGVHAHLLPQATNYTARYWRLVIDAQSLIETSPGGYMDMTRAWAGEVFSFDINADYGAEIQWLANSNIVKGDRSAAESVDVGEGYRNMTLTFSGVSSSEYNKLLDFDMITAGQRQILFGFNKSDLGRFTMLCRNSQTSGITYSSPSRFRKRLRLIESL